MSVSVMPKETPSELESYEQGLNDRILEANGNAQHWPKGTASLMPMGMLRELDAYRLAPNHPSLLSMAPHDRIHDANGNAQ